MTLEVIKPLTVANNIRSLQKTDSFKLKSPRSPSSPKNPCKMRVDRSLSFKSWETDEKKLRISVSFKLSGFDDYGFSLTSPCQINDSPVPSISPRARGELDAAAIKVQKVYKSYRTRRSLADCAVVVEELWWKSDNASSDHNCLSYLNVRNPETAASRWARAGTRAAKVGKGLLKDNKAQKLALRHWLEAIDPRHRYGHNLHMYHNVWFRSESTQPFFYWLDVGEGKELNLEKCPRSMLQSQCIKYLGPKEREAYEIIVKNGKLVYKNKSQVLLDTIDGSKWIFVLSTSRNLYVGQKIKGKFQHSSFLSGGATSAAGRLVAKNGILKAIWPYSGHYRPTEENFKEFISFLEEKNLDLTNVKRCSIDDDEYTTSENFNYNPADDIAKDQSESDTETGTKSDRSASDQISSSSSSSFKYSPRLSCDWTSGAGARILCVRDYPSELQSKALEQVNLSPRIGHSSSSSLTDMIKVPIPSPRPSPGMRLSPRLASIGFPSPWVSLTMPANKKR